MPTGYTAAIKDGITFENFILRCARGMGALILMRDDPHDAPIPEKFEPEDFYLKEIEKAQKDLDQYMSLTPEAADIEAKTEYDAEISRRMESIKESIALRHKYEEMLAKVREWQPPSLEHIELKEFMEEQITKSIKFDYITGDYYEKFPVELLAGKVWLTKKIADITANIARYTKEYEEEVQRTNGRNMWIKQLRESL